MVKVIMESSEIPKDKMVVIDFFATWCGPCQRIAPLFEQLSNTYKSIEFIKVDVDQGEDLAVKYDVFSLPTFVFMNNGTVTLKMETSEHKELEDAVEKFNEAVEKFNEANKENILQTN